MNKKNLLWSLLPILFASMFSVSLVSCGSDNDEEDSPKTQKTSYGKDGLKGYWMEEPTTQNWMISGNKACVFLYLDGEGGGTRFYPGDRYDSNRFSTTYQEASGGNFGSIPYTKLFKTVKDNTGDIYTLYGFDGEDAYGLPLIYTQTGSTITIVINSGYSSFMVNVADGTLTGYKRVTIVN